MTRRTVTDWAADAALVLFALAVWAMEMSTFPESYEKVTPEWMLTVDPIIGLAACMLLWWRRRFPTAIGLGMLPILVVAGTSFGASLVAVFTVAIYRDWRISTGITSAYLLVTVPFFYSEADAQTSVLASTLTGALLYIAPMALGIAVRSRHELAASRERERRLELADARRTERRRIASEMHDVLTHRISLVSMHSGALAYRVGDGGDRAAPAISDAELARAVEVIRQNAYQALTELGEVLTVLRSGEHEELTQPGLQRIPHLIADARAAGQPIEFDPGTVLDRTEEIRPQLAGTIFRVVQEGLTNARKHAPGAPVSVHLVLQPEGELLLRISNPMTAGAEPPELPGIGAGLTGLAERVRLDHGTLRHGAADGVFQLTVRLPWST